MTRYASVAVLATASAMAVALAPAPSAEAAAGTPNPVRGCSATPVFAHRGDTKLYTENTRAAVDSALRVGAAVEVDVRTAADGTLVLMHNRTVDRTTNGTGAVADQTWKQLRRHRTADGYRIPKVARILRMVRDHRGGQVMLDVKALTPESARALVGRVERFGIRSRVRFISFSYEMLDLLRSIDRNLPTVKIFGGTEAPSTVEGGHGAQLFPRLMTDDWVAAMNRAGVRLTARAEDDLTGWRRSIEVGVHGLVSDEPRAYLRACRRGRLPDTRA